MALLLSLETSSHVCSVALHQNGQLLIAKHNNIPQSTASVLAPMIDAVLSETHHSAKDISGIIISAGPGSYTGLRIGVATAKGLCYALQIPLMAVNTLELIAYQFLEAKSPMPEQALLCPMLDARRMEVYCMLLNSNREIVHPTHAKVVDNDSFSAHLTNHPIYFFGDGSDKCKNVISHPNAQFVSGVLPQAAILGEMGYLKWKTSQFEDIATYEPLYLKDFMIKKPNLI